MINNVHLNPKCKDHLVYPVPPPHMFCRITQPDKIRSFFFIWVCIRAHWLSRLYQEGLSSACLSLTADKWRDILGGIYWKQLIPLKGRVFDATVDAPFDLQYFWKHGDPLIFGYLDVASGVSEDRSPLLSDIHMRLEPEDFDSDDLKSLVLWDLSLVNVQVQFDRADEIFVPPNCMDPIEWEFRRDQRRDMFHLRGWLIAGSLPPWEQPYGLPRRRWVARLLEFLRLWPAIKDASWLLGDLESHRGLQWKTMSHDALGEMVKFSLTVKEVNNLERDLITVYSQGVFDSLGVLTVALMKRPSLNTPGMTHFFTI